MSNVNEYFLLKQDERYNRTPIIVDLFKKIDKRNISREKSFKIPNILILNIRKEEKINFIDVLDSPLFLVNKSMRDILKKYDTNIIFKNIALLDHVEKKQGNYVLPILEEVDALSNDSILNLDRSVVKKIVLDKKKIEGKKIFKIKGIAKNLIVVRLDVAESLLRRKYVGMKLDRLEIK